MTKKSNIPENIDDYWKEREKKQRQYNLEHDAQIDEEIERIYKQMADNIQQEIDSFYAKYAKNSKISLSEAKKRVSKLDIEAYERKAEEYVKNKDFSDKANEEMKLYNTTMKINRLEMLKSRIGMAIAIGTDDLDKFGKDDLIDETYQEQLRMAGILGFTVRKNEKYSRIIAESSFHNATFSDRVWGNAANLKSELERQLMTGLIQGRNHMVLSRDMAKRMNVSLYNAKRLLHTELKRCRTEAQKQSYVNGGYDQYKFLALGNACDICKELNGRIFNVKDMEPGKNAPPMHPNCRCSTAPTMDEELYNKWLDGFKEHGLSFEDWMQRKEFIKNELVQSSYARLEKNINKSLIASGLNKFVAYKAKGTKNELYVSERVDITNKKIRKFDSCYSRALKFVGASYENIPDIVIVDSTELKLNSIGSFDARTNNLYIYKGLDTYESKKINNPKKMMNEENALITFVHELNHWKDSLEYEKKYGKISKDNYLDYLDYCNKKGYELFENMLKKGYDISEVSNYAKRSILSGNYDEIRIDYNAYKSIGGKDNDLSRNDKEKE